jgi:nicotinamidase-related amidase
MRSIASPPVRKNRVIRAAWNIEPNRRRTDTLVPAGLSTSGVVLSTLIEAADRDYRLYILSDGTDDPDAQTRDVLLGKVFPKRAQITDTAGR